MTNLPGYFSRENFVLRTLVDKDIESLVDIINDAYSYQDKAKGEPRTSPTHLRKRAGEVDFYVVTKGDRIVACVYIDSQDTALHFGLLTVIPEFRGTGLAQSIMKAIEDYARANQFKTLELDYMSLAPWLKTYYEKYGFTETGAVQPWGSIDLIRMSKDLK